MSTWTTARLLPLGLMLGLLLSPAEVRSQDPLDALMRDLASVPGVQATFREEKRIALLSSPLVNRGTLYFAPPSKLARHTREPMRSTVLIDGRRLVMGDASGRREINLADNPMVESFVAPFMGLLGGDRSALERSYRVELERPATDPEAWSIRLTPRSPAVRRAISEIRAEGRGRAVLRIVVVEQNGDVSDTVFSDVNTERRYSRRELARFFRVELARP